MVLAAASLEGALGDVASAWVARGHASPALSFAGTPALARQVESGIQADIVLFADEAWMDRLAERALLAPGSRTPLLGNRLVVVAPVADGTTPSDLAAALATGRIAMGEPGSVPAGRYARAALTHAGLWDTLEPRVIPTENVRAALALAERGEVEHAVVYASDAMASNKVRIVADLPTAPGQAIRYPMARLKRAAHPDSAALEAFLRSAEAAAIFRKHGFESPVP